MSHFKGEAGDTINLIQPIYEIEIPTFIMVERECSKIVNEFIFLSDGNPIVKVS